MTQRRYKFSWDFIGDIEEGRPSLGNETRIEIYRLFQYTLRDVLEERYGADEADRILYEAGFVAGKNFCEKFVTARNSFDEFIQNVTQALLDFKVGILRMESVDHKNATFTLTVSEDLDCSGLPEMGNSVCNYDEGFLSAVFGSYIGRDFDVKEIDCWCTADRTCRFQVKPKEQSTVKKA